MGQYSKIILVGISLLFAAALVACLSNAALVEPVLFLNSAQTSQELPADQIISFYVTFSQQAAEIAEIVVSLETLEGSDWKAALCYEDQCFMHDGRQKLVHGMSSGEVTEFDIKYFVPAEALPGESKTVRMEVWLQGKSRQKATIDLLGYLPEP